MMAFQLFADYHTHPQGHRVQGYTRELLQPWVDSARARGIIELAFTDHDRYHAGIDFDEINRLREDNPDLKIRAGIELARPRFLSLAWTFSAEMKNRIASERD